jgi:hypothetical protein
MSAVSTKRASRVLGRNGRKVCACGCGKPVGATSTWVAGSHAARARSRKYGGSGLGIPSAHRDESLGEPMRGECAWCGTGWNGTAEEVIASQAQHREVCEKRPPAPVYSLAEKRKMQKQGRSEQKIRAAEVAREDQAARVAARDEKLRLERAAKVARSQRAGADRKGRDDAVTTLFEQGRSYSQIVAQLNAAGIKPAAADVWTTGTVSGICVRLGLRRRNARPVGATNLLIKKLHDEDGLTHKEIAASLNDRGVVTVRGLPWTSANVFRVLRSL